MGTKLHELENEHSCLSRALPEEPLFILRANDHLAPLIVRRWAAQYFDRMYNSGHWDDHRQAKWKEALEIATQMEEWKKAHPG